jgi:aminodeoxyfutalosine deaminase
MSYRKLKADYLFDGYNMLPSGSVLVCRQDGMVEDIVNEDRVDGDLEKFPGMIVPGLINCHCHLELSHLKAVIPEKQGLVNFVLSVMSQRFQTFHLKEEQILTAENNMLNTGIVALGDICNTADTGAAKQAKLLSYYNFIEIFGWVPDQATTRHEAGKKLAASFIDMGFDKNHLSLNPHAPYSVSDQLWNLMKQDFKNKTITIHNQESAAENEYFTSGTGDLARMYGQMKMDTSQFIVPGSRSLPYILSRLQDAGQILLVHNTYTDETDLIKITGLNKRVFLCLCPNANLYIEDRLPDIPLFVKHNSLIVLGTDSLASNHQLSILEEMKTIKKAFSYITTSEMLVWATSNGAKALAFEDKLGDFTRGKKPGVVLLENITDGEITRQSTSRRLL